MNNDFYNNSSYCEKFRGTFFAEILNVDKTRPRKDLIFFNVCIVEVQDEQKLKEEEERGISVLKGS